MIIVATTGRRSHLFTKPPQATSTSRLLGPRPNPIRAIVVACILTIPLRLLLPAPVNTTAKHHLLLDLTMPPGSFVSEMQPEPFCQLISSRNYLPLQARPTPPRREDDIQNPNFPVRTTSRLPLVPRALAACEPCRSKKTRVRPPFWRLVCLPARRHHYPCLGS